MKCNAVFTMLEKLTLAVKPMGGRYGSMPFVEISVEEWRAIPDDLAVSMFDGGGSCPVLNGVNVLVRKEGI